MDTKNLITQKHYFRGELALLIAVLMNSFGVVLMLHSGSGISAISSVPYAFSAVFPHISLWKMYIERNDEEKIFQLDKDFHKLLYILCGDRKSVV